LAEGPIWSAPSGADRWQAGNRLARPGPSVRRRRTPHRRGRGATPKPLAGLSPTRRTTAVGRKLWTVPHPRNPFFEGRDDVIKDLGDRLAKRGRAALVQAQAITGLGGIGKTQTAVEYAYRYRDEYKAVLWLNAESALALNTGSAELAR